MDQFSIHSNREKFIDHWPGSAKLYLLPDGTVPSIGQRMKNSPLADLLSTLVEESRRAQGGPQKGLLAAQKAFYEGDIAAEVEAFVQERDGFLSREDLVQFRTYREEPVSASFRDTTVFKCGPWSQGPVFLQLLKLLEGFDLEGLTHNSADYLHLWVEAAKLAYADREQYYADPRYVFVPLEELLSDGYNLKRRQLIDWKHASSLHRPGDPMKGDPLLPPDIAFHWDSWGYGTVHVAVIDERGNMAALTPSGGWICGNEVIPSLGFPLTTRLQTFFLDEKHPNVLAPGKRPRTTLSPSLAFLSGRPWMVFGTMGGDQQDQWTSQFFLNHAVFKMSLQGAIEAPKVTCAHIPATFYPHDAFPGQVRIEGRIPLKVREQMHDRGHKIEVESDWIAGFICAVSRNEEGLLQSGADPRGHRACVFPSCALAW